MEEIYLDEQLKDYYLKDFNENVLTETDALWKLSEQVKPYLICLNSIKIIQSLYSRFPDTSRNNESYLTFAYFKEKEMYLFREFLPFFIIKFNDLNEEMKFYYTFSKPKANCNYSEEKTKFFLGCICNPDYFKINHIQLTFKSYEIKKHEEFWNALKMKFLEVDANNMH